MLPWVDLDGVRHDGRAAPQQQWQFASEFSPALVDEIRAVRAAHESACRTPATPIES
jgi:hypothetical protein